MVAQKCGQCGTRRRRALWAATWLRPWLAAGWGGYISTLFISRAISLKFSFKGFGAQLELWPQTALLYFLGFGQHKPQGKTIFLYSLRFRSSKSAYGGQRGGGGGHLGGYCLVSISKHSWIPQPLQHSTKVFIGGY